ncbi:hypothetical protein [Streptomyces sp. NPDC000410]|uniref:hypothetical protein n=1 Tax=Streptomyces sp. NPDC000410 TaxID=3154254 RepID=UPI00332D3A70
MLIDVHAAELEQTGHGRLSEEAAVTFVGLDRHVLALLIAASPHERTLRPELSFPDTVSVPLAAPQEEGATGTLRRSAYNALKFSSDWKTRAAPRAHCCCAKPSALTRTTDCCAAP